MPSMHSQIIKLTNWYIVDFSKAFNVFKKCYCFWIKCFTVLNSYKCYDISNFFEIFYQIKIRSYIRNKMFFYQSILHGIVFCWQHCYYLRLLPHASS